MFWLLLEFVGAECWFGPTITVLQHLLPPAVHGGAQGIFSTLVLLGNLAPLLIGAMQRTQPMPQVLLLVVPALYLGSALSFGITMVLAPAEQPLSSKEMSYASPSQRPAPLALAAVRERLLEIDEAERARQDGSPSPPR
mmetsp:Transcript_2460/g.6560  ORF Transcript_2460/g.6560 Transcript_2460/m.6560 type:complete len:139 (+) Transcript_2460:334-750(+)